MAATQERPTARWQPARSKSLNSLTIRWSAPDWVVHVLVKAILPRIVGNANRLKKNLVYGLDRLPSCRISQCSTEDGQGDGRTSLGSRYEAWKVLDIR
jgi:hypothetical protein